MNYEAAIVLARQRMCEIGKAPDEYHIDVLSLVGTQEERRAGLITYKAYNEYLYLIDYPNYYGLIIFSDDAFFHADDYSLSSKTQEFTGEVIIMRLPEKSWSIDGLGGREGIIRRLVPVDFVRVIIH